MDGKELILALALFVAIVAGVIVVALSASRASRQAKPTKVWLIGFLVMIAGGVLGFVVVQLILALDVQG